jgi:hypothetical protein
MSFAGLLLVLSFIPCAQAQLANGTFIAPVPNMPFTAVSQLETSRITPDGTSIRLKTFRAMARDSQGRVYKEARKLQSATENAIPPVIMIALYEPRAKLYTYIYPENKTFWNGTLKQPASLLAREYFYGWPTRYGPPLSQDTKVEDLGTRTMHGLPVHGVRQTGSQIVGGKNVVATDEYWYSDDLQLNLLAIHQEPSVTLTVTVTELARNEPNVNIFDIPARYQRKGSPEPPY